MPPLSFESVNSVQYVMHSLKHIIVDMSMVITINHIAKNIKL